MIQIQGLGRLAGAGGANMSFWEKVQELQTLNYTRKQCARALKYLANKHTTAKFWQSCLSMVVDTNETLGEIANDAHH